MEQNILKFRDEFYPQAGGTYSVCMRGARQWDKSKALEIYTKGNGALIETPIEVEPNYTASIVSQQQFRFVDLTKKDWEDNYNKSVRGDSRIHLESAMGFAYGGEFHFMELVTILRFKIH